MRIRPPGIAESVGVPAFTGLLRYGVSGGARFRIRIGVTAQVICASHQSLAVENHVRRRCGV